MERDEVAYGTPLHGRKTGSGAPERFHGAFTGGFSAGYFNSVGSKEGWAPRTFSFSRKNGGTKVEQRVEDFMDEEDLRQQEERTRLVPAGVRPQTAEAALARLIRGTVDIEGVHAAGFKMLQQMGWRVGQGIGPKVSRVVNDKVFELAPKEDEIKTISGTLKRHGIGYDVELPELPSGSVSVGEILNKSNASKKRKLAMNVRAAAAYDGDDEDDDEDDDLVLRPRLGTKYDTAIGKAPRFKSRKRAAPLPTNQKSWDGSPVLPGFVLATRPIYEPKQYPRLHIGGEMVRKTDGGSDMKNQNVSTPTTASSIQRARILGEHVPEIKPDTEQKPVGSGQIKRELPSGFEFLQSAAAEPELEIPYVDPAVAKEALANPTAPYSDPAKRQRYYAFLQYHAAEDDKKPKLSTTDLQEMKDFARVALVFRPLRGEIANRFAHASSQRTDNDDGTLVQGRLRSAAKEAALAEQYGPLTQTTTRFIPEKLLAKRFGVPYTFITEEIEDDMPSAPQNNQSSLAQTAMPSELPSQQIPEQQPPEAAEKAPLDVFQSVFGDDDDDDSDE